MTAFEYKIVPAPQKGLKGKGMRTTEARFANALTSEVNKLARDGWEYLRSETLPCIERSTLGTKSNSFQSVLVFRREVQEDDTLKLAAPEQGKSLFAPFGKSVGPASKTDSSEKSAAPAIKDDKAAKQDETDESEIADADSDNAEDDSKKDGKSA